MNKESHLNCGDYWGSWGQCSKSALMQTSVLKNKNKKEKPTAYKLLVNVILFFSLAWMLRSVCARVHA